ncbi:MAG: endonuclease/exonuclease/phosphatase family protein [Luteibaculum sp.]
MSKLLSYTVVGAFLLLYALSYFAPYLNPSSFWYFAFLGLAFPYLFIAGIVLFVFLFIGSNKLKWILLIALVPGFFKMDLFFRLSGGKNFADDDIQVKVFSYNVRSFNRYKWIEDEHVFSDILRIIKIHNPDILLLQEFYASDVAKRDSLCKLISETCDLPYYNGFGPLKSKKVHGLFTFSRFPIDHSIEVRFVDQGVNGFLDSKILYPGKPFRVINFHLASYQLNPAESANSNEEEIKSAFYKLKNGMIRRGDQVRQLKQHITESQLLPLICGGDLNDTPHSYAYNTISEFLADSYTEAGSGEGKTYVGKLPGFRIDYLFHSESFQAKSYYSVREEKSDHYPIVAEFAY